MNILNQHIDMALEIPNGIQKLQVLILTLVMQEKSALDGRKDGSNTDDLRWPFSHKVGLVLTSPSEYAPNNQ